MASVDLVFLNGWTFVPAVLKAATGRPVAILGRNFAFRPFRPLLNKLADVAENSGLFRPLYDLCPELAYYREFLGYADRTDLFARTLNAQRQLYGFSVFDSHAPDYAIAAKHAACNNTRLLALTPFLLQALEARRDEGDTRVSGVDQDALALHEAYFGKGPAFSVEARREMRILTNALHALMMLAYGCLWILSRIRMNANHDARRRLGVDFSGADDRRGFQLVREIVSSPGDVLYVFRRPNPPPQDVLAVAGYACAAIGDGYFTPKAALAAIKLLINDTLRLARLAINLSPELFTQVTAMPVRRLAYRAFFNRHPCDYFLARDDYNSEHSLRSQELRRIGGRSLGIMHAIPSDNDEEPSMWFVDFDYYYCFGRRIVKHHPEWPKHMTVRLEGAWAMSSQQLERLHDPRPNDFIFYGRGGLREGAMIDVVRKLAVHFKDRTVYIKLKAGSRRYPPNMQELMKDLPRNVSVIDPAADTYDLMFKAQYAFSSGSTVIAEALQYGLKVFVFDLHPELPFVFRNFPGLIVGSAEEMIKRIERMESGQETYDAARFSDLIEIGSRNIFKVIRSDMSQPPNKAPNSQPR
ncbi:MAG: hypothetical protein HQL44_04955 [Alphaproteobacteria bacterium]|nr:hypothetical protein [Alphaproteobacteria bacterium]